MTVVTTIAALLMFVVGSAIPRLLVRRWFHLDLPLTAVNLPRLCPVCLSAGADQVVSEKSPKRTTRNYILAYRREWFALSVPHCSRCARKLFTFRVAGFLLGALVAAGVYFLAPPPEPSLTTFCYILFGYPVYELITNLPKGLICSKADATGMRLHLKQHTYFGELINLNPGATIEVTAQQERSAISVTSAEEDHEIRIWL